MAALWLPYPVSVWEQRSLCKEEENITATWKKGKQEGEGADCWQEAGAVRPVCLNGKLLISFRRHIVIAADGTESHLFPAGALQPCCQGGEVPTQLE